VGIVEGIRLKQRIAGGAFFQSQPRILRSKQSYLDEICLRLGGVAAETLIVGCITDGAGAGTASDLAIASDIATLMVAEFGMGDVLRHTHTLSFQERQQLRKGHRDVEREVSELLSSQLARAETIVRHRVQEVEAVATALEEKGTLTGNQVVDLMSVDGSGRQTQ
jgi:ATP-dependent Zn protease